jgi:nucleotide-binding universal stress UspA family protein
MSYRTLMTVPTLGRSNAPLMEATASLARRHDASILGLAGCRPIQCVCRDYAIPAGAFEEDRKQIERQIKNAELEFRNAMAGLNRGVDWTARTCLEPLAALVAEQAVAADLIVVPLDGGPDAVDETRQVDLCDLVMRAGRPVLLVPAAQPSGAFERVLVAWKDTREARRAIADALPILAKATALTVVAIEDGGDTAAARTSVARVQAWLGRHGIAAQTKVVPATQANGPQLAGISRETRADLIVAGAFAYSRQGRWILGGITSELLGGTQCALLSH